MVHNYYMKRAAEDSTYTGAIFLLTAVLAELHTGAIATQFGMDGYLYPVCALFVVAFYAIFAKEKG